jgi:Zn-dependent protease
MTCAGCAAEIGPLLLACPSCHTLVHADRLKTLAAAAASARSGADTGAELTAWREALELLPPTAEQYQRIRARVEQLSAGLIDGTSFSSSANPANQANQTNQAGQTSPAGAANQHSTSQSKNYLTGGVLTAAALFLWKFKALVVVALTKGKLLLAGLTNSTTLLTMLPSIGLYWTAYGWRFALGIVLSIYVHEMGHVAALRRFGIAASAPMFIPGLGALIRSRQQPTSPRELARVGLGGPIWGLGAAVAAFAMYGLTGAPIWAAIGQFGAWVNLFNLMPVWQLDGAHAFTAMDRRARWLAAAAAAVMFVVTREGLLIIVAIFAGIQAVGAARAVSHTGVTRATPDAREVATNDSVITAQFIGLIVILSVMARLITPNAHL